MVFYKYLTNAFFRRGLQCKADGMAKGGGVAYPLMYDLQFLQENMFVVPVPFAKYHRNVSALQKMAEYQNGQSQIKKILLIMIS
jgi:hypothetical protein